MPTKEAKASGGTKTCWPECRMHPKPPEPPDWPGTRVTTPVNTRPGEAAGNQEGHGLGIYPQGSADTATPAGRNLGPWLWAIATKRNRPKRNIGLELPLKLRPCRVFSHPGLQTHKLNRVQSIGRLFSEHLHFQSSTGFHGF